MTQNNHQIALTLARLRAEVGSTQATVASKAELDQSRISRIEKMGSAAPEEIERVIDALVELGSKRAADYKNYRTLEWAHIEPPSFFNPQRPSLELAESTLTQIEAFLSDDERPWPLRRQIERHRDSILKVCAYLNKLQHNIAFIGEIGVGKSTAISFLFDLLVPPSLADKSINRPVLETGAGGTTICEVHIKSGPEFGISLQPMALNELRALVADFCAAKWALVTQAKKADSESASVSREVERAIRNMTGLVRRRETVEGKLVYHDPVQDLVRSSATEEEFRTRVLGLMDLEGRTRRALWYDSSTRKHPMEWVAETFKAVNNGRINDVSLPKTIDLLIPDFGRSFGELDVTVIDTKGVDDVAVREDLDARLKDPRTTVVFCSRFNDAPGTAARVLLQHMQQTFSEPVNAGKVAILALPRAEEARSMKDDMGEPALTDSEGYEFKRLQVESALAAENLADVPTVFYNVEADPHTNGREELFRQLSRMRENASENLVSLCAAAEDIIKNHEAQALSAAMEEVAARLSSFLAGNRTLGAREMHGYEEVLSTLREVRYASTLWACTRRNGDYFALNVLHLIGVGAAKDARVRSGQWFHALDGFINMLEADEGLSLAKLSIQQISRSAASSQREFLESVQRAGVEVYREPLSKAAVWRTCVGEWGQGPGFKNRVSDHLGAWFADNPTLKSALEDMVNKLWSQIVIEPLLQLASQESVAAAC